MSIFGSLFGKKKEAAPHPVRATLFGDIPLDEFPPIAAPEAFPWSTFALARSHLAAGDQSAAVGCWRQILEHPGLEPRHYLQAWHFLRQHGQLPRPDIAKQVLGVVVEIGLPEGPGLVAAYPDHSARLYNYKAGAVVWEHPDTSLDLIIDQLLEASRRAVAQIGPWKQARPAPPPPGQVRLCFLTPSGLHFRQGPTNVVLLDPLGTHVLQFTIVLMKELNAKAK